jgi:hypothetical protein
MARIRFELRRGKPAFALSFRRRTRLWRHESARQPVFVSLRRGKRAIFLERVLLIWLGLMVLRDLKRPRSARRPTWRFMVPGLAKPGWWLGSHCERGTGGMLGPTRRSARAVGRRKPARFAFRVFNRVLNMRAYPSGVLRKRLSVVSLVSLVSLKSISLGVLLEVKPATLPLFFGFCPSGLRAHTEDGTRRHEGTKS